MAPAPVECVAGLRPPVAFVLSGGASLGAVQVGMVQALAQVGLEPDLVVGTSVGALNGVVIAQHESLGLAAGSLERTWRDLRRRDILPGGALAQARALLATGHLHANHGLSALIRRSLVVDDFDQLARPMVVVAADVLTGHVHRFRQGQLLPTLLAATALPGLFPPVAIAGRHYWDGGPVANVPLQTAVVAGAGSIVVLDAGDVCHRDQLPRGIPDGLLTSVMTAMRQRVMVEAPNVARHLPVLYLPRPCAHNRSLLDFDSSAELIEPTRELVVDFLVQADSPSAGHLVGTPHHHPDEGRVAA